MKIAAKLAFAIKCYRRLVLNFDKEKVSTVFWLHQHQCLPDCFDIVVLNVTFKLCCYVILRLTIGFRNQVSCGHNSQIKQLFEHMH